MPGPEHLFWSIKQRLAQLNLSEAQARSMPLLTVLEQSFEQQTRQRQKRQSKTQKLPQVGSKRHSISLSAAGWEGLATLALGVHRSDAETIELLGNHAAQLQQPLADWLKKPEESIVRQILASPP